MGRLLDSVKELQKGSVKALVDARLREFSEAGKMPGSWLFKELCFCILTANFDAEKSIALQKKIGNGFLKMRAKQLEAKLRKLGYRYPNRAAYICDSRKHLKELKQKTSSEDEFALREWLALNVKGLGMKEASHFMRNIGFQNVAIIDFHVVDLLARHGLIDKPKAMTKKRYIEIEKALRGIADKLGVSLAELDLYLWFMETGKVLK